MKKIPYSRWLCFFLIFMMVFSGVRTGTVGTDSCFASSGSVSYSTGIQKVSNGRISSALFERKIQERTGEAALEKGTVRSTGTRAAQWIWAYLVSLAVFLLSGMPDVILIQSRLCRNQSRWRILEYIHHKDGKKA